MMGDIHVVPGQHPAAVLVRIPVHPRLGCPPTATSNPEIIWRAAPGPVQLRQALAMRVVRNQLQQTAGSRPQRRPARPTRERQREQDLADEQAVQSQNSLDSVESPIVDQVLRDEGNFIQNVSQFFNQEALSDVVLRIEDQKYFAHKFVLATSSDVFRTMLYDPSWSHTVRDEIELNESSECQAVFDKFLRYLYTAEININSNTAVGVLCLADKYNVKSLKHLCGQYMVENSRSPRVRNALTWYSWAKALNMTDLITQCMETMAWNAEEIITSTEWTAMEPDYICDIMQSSELVIPNEYCLYEALQRWLLHESRLDQLGNLSQKLLPLVRFPQMLVSQLYSLEQCELASNPQTHDLMHELISQAYRFRALCPSQHQLNASFNTDFYLPRDYAYLTVDNVRMQNTLRFGLQVDVRMYRGPVPTEARDADWKITYRKQGDVWVVQVYCHETAMVNNEARFQASVIIYNDSDKVIQVERAPTFVCTRGNSMTMQVSVTQADAAKNMAVLIKPVPILQTT